uniref:Uncharacterized protein n=2 Tax=Caenorhabditis japonica TaxID=281687 RepID=A0A8R1DMU5_CAEJA
MRSAQLAQKAQMAPQMPIPQDPYSQLLSYPMYQPLEIPAGYPPFVYSPAVFRAPPQPAPPNFQPARPAPVQYHPMAYYHQQPQRKNSKS